MSALRPSTGVWLFPDAEAAAIVDAIGTAERLGIDEVWLGDEGPGRDPFLLLAAAARSTATVRLGIAVTNPYLRHPAATAAAALTLQELSGGRFVLGIGAGGGMALDPVGVARAHPLARVRDAIRITRAVAAGAATDGYVPPPYAVPPAALPIVVGARGERLNRLASEVADGVFLGGIPLAVLPDALAWARSVRPIEAVVSVIAAFDAASRERVRPQLVWTLFDAPASTRAALGVDVAQLRIAVDALQRGDDAPARELVTDSIVDELVVHGDPAAMTARLERITADLRPDSLVLNLHANGDPVAAVTAAAAVLAPLGAATVPR